MCICGSSSAWAATVSGSGYTDGGNGGTTRITYTFNCKANYTTTVDACIIEMRASSGNVVEFSYGQMTTSLKNGGYHITSLTGEKTNAMNTKTWTKVTGNAGQNYATKVTYLKGGLESIYGFKEFKDVQAVY